MRKIFEDITNRLNEFITQRDDLALVVRCSEAESSAVLQLLETIEEASTSEIFWMFPDAFKNPIDYASSVVNTFTHRHDLVRLLQKEQDMPQWPLVPEIIHSDSTPPAHRLRDLMIFARSLLPTLEGGLLVWVMMPLEINDTKTYASLVKDVLEHDFPFPWCHHMRIVVRNVPDDSALTTTLAGTPRISWYEPDLSTHAMEQALENEAADDELPLDERLQAMLQTAGIDYSHKRYEQALEKYQLAFRFYSATKNPTLTAVSLNGLGEVHQALGQKAEAVTCFEAAVTSATAQENVPVPVMLTSVLNLGSFRMAEQRWEEAEGYYDVAQKLATLLRAVEIKIMAIEKLGEAQYQQMKVSEALASWTAGATLAEKLEQPEQHKSLLEHMRNHYTAVGDRTKVMELEQEMSALD
jgi:hypothetical protein